MTLQQGCYNQYYLEIAQAIKLAGFNPADAVEVLNILELAEISSESGKK